MDGEKKVEVTAVDIHHVQSEFCCRRTESVIYFGAYITKCLQTVIPNTITEANFFDSHLFITKQNRNKKKFLGTSSQNLFSVHENRWKIQTIVPSNESRVGYQSFPSDKRKHSSLFF